MNDINSPTEYFHLCKDEGLTDLEAYKDTAEMYGLTIEEIEYIIGEGK